MFAKTFSKNSNLDDWGILLPFFLPKTNLKLYNNFFATHKMVKKVITNFHSSKVSGPDYFSVVFLKNCGTKLSYILAEPFKMCLEESCFPDSRMSYRWFLYLRIFGKVSVLSVVSKDFENLVNNRIVDHDLISSMAVSLCDQLWILWQFYPGWPL